MGVRSLCNHRCITRLEGCHTKHAIVNEFSSAVEYLANMFASKKNNRAIMM